MSVNTGCYWIKSVKGEWYCTVNRTRGDALSERCKRCEKENRPIWKQYDGGEAAE